MLPLVIFHILIPQGSNQMLKKQNLVALKVLHEQHHQVTADYNQLSTKHFLNHVSNLLEDTHKHYPHQALHHQLMQSFSLEVYFYKIFFLRHNPELEK